MKNKDTSALDAVAKSASTYLKMEAQLQAQAAAWVAVELAEYTEALEESVYEARDDGHSIVDIARAYTLSGKTPNRNAIYAILSSRTTPRDDDLPFEWVSRTIKTARGKRVVYDVQADLEEFGPENVSGEYTWRYDTSNHELDPVLTDQNLYPYEINYYRRVLDRWVTNNPYPGEEEA